MKKLNLYPQQKRPYFVGFTLVLLFLLSYFFYQRYIQRREALDITQPPETKIQEEVQSLPIRLKIPSIQVDSFIQYVGVDPKGAMDVPSNTIDVGWFKLGPKPGEIGSAVIAGHFDGEQGETAVFTNLYKLMQGDKLYIEDDQGKTLTFVVREKRTFKPGYADEVFNQTGGAHLNLITCDGVWDGVSKTYSERLVIFADLEE